MEKSLAGNYVPPVIAATVWRGIPERSRSNTIEFLHRETTVFPIAGDFQGKDFYSRLIHAVLEIHRVERGGVTCLVSVSPAVTNNFGTLHGGAVAAIAEVVSIACARTVVAEDKELFLGELAMSYLSSAPKNAELMVNASIVISGRNVTVVAVDFKMKKTRKLVYTARATFYNLPTAKL